MKNGEKQLRSFLNLDDDAPLSPVTRAMLDQYIDIPPDEFFQVTQAIPNAIRFMGANGYMPSGFAQQVSDFMTANPALQQRSLRDQLMLFAAGAQLAFDSLPAEQQRILSNASDLKTVYEQTNLRNVDANGIHVLYAHTLPEDETNPSSVIVTLGASVGFAIKRLIAAQPTATQDQRDEYNKQIHLALHAGAEETLHALQAHDPVIAADLDRQLIARYGDNWRTERAAQNTRAHTSQANVNAFQAQDPFEIDVHKRLDTFEHRINALTEKFLASTVSRA